MVLFGSLIGWVAFSWTPSWAQHFLAVAMIVTTAYGWEACLEDTDD